MAYNLLFVSMKGSKKERDREAKSSHRLYFQTFFFSKWFARWTKKESDHHKMKWKQFWIEEEKETKKTRTIFIKHTLLPISDCWTSMFFFFSFYVSSQYIQMIEYICVTLRHHIYILLGKKKKQNISQSNSETNVFPFDKTNRLFFWQWVWCVTWLNCENLFCYLSLRLWMEIISIYLI